MISQYHTDFLARHFRIKKTQKLVIQKYYWPMLRVNIESYIKKYNISLASKIVRHRYITDLRINQTQ